MVSLGITANIAFAVCIPEDKVFGVLTILLTLLMVLVGAPTLGLRANRLAKKESNSRFARYFLLTILEGVVIINSFLVINYFISKEYILPAKLGYGMLIIILFVLGAHLKTSKQVGAAPPEEGG